MLGKGEHRAKMQTGLGKAQYTEGWGKKGVAKLTRTEPEVVVRAGSPTHFAHFLPLLSMHPDGLVLIYGGYK